MIGKKNEINYFVFEFLKMIIGENKSIFSYFARMAAICFLKVFSKTNVGENNPIQKIYKVRFPFRRRLRVENHFVDDFRPRRRFVFVVILRLRR